MKASIIMGDFIVCLEGFWDSILWDLGKFFGGGKFEGTGKFEGLSKKHVFDVHFYYFCIHPLFSRLH